MNKCPCITAHHTNPGPAPATDLPAGTYRFVTWNVDWFGRHRPTRTRTELLTPHLDGVVAF